MAETGARVMYLTGVISVALRARARQLGLGMLTTPTLGRNDYLPDFVAWAADNGCFAAGDDFDVRGWLRWLCTLPTEGCLFAVAPDVVGDAQATWARSAPWLPVIRLLGFPAAWVAQDGAEHTTIEWDAFDAVFIGGSTEWKTSEAARSICVEGRKRGKHVHIGRVNSLRRMQWAATVADSVDGTFLAFGPDVNLPRLNRWLAALAHAPQFDYEATFVTAGEA